MKLLITYCLIAFTAVAFAGWEINELGIYRPLMLHHAVVTQEGEVFVINQEECVIHHLDSSGEIIKTIGAKGKGPGELQVPIQIFFDNDMIHVYDLVDASISSFTKSGQFQRKVKQPVPRGIVFKGTRGWVVLERALGTPDSNTRKMFYFDDNLENKQLIAEWDRGVAGKRYPFQKGVVSKIPLAIVSDIAQVELSVDRSKLFIVTPGENTRLKIFDFQTGKMITDTALNLSAISFDKEWAMEELKKRQATASAAGRNVQYVPGFPEYYPKVRAIRPLPDNRLALIRWNHADLTKCKVIEFETDGSYKDLSIAPEVLTRWLGIHGDIVYLTTYDEESGAGIGCCKLDDVNDFVKKHVISSDD